MSTSSFVVNVLQNDPHYLDQGQDQSTKSQGACMVSEKIVLKSSFSIFIHLLIYFIKPMITVAYEFVLVI